MLAAATSFFSRTAISQSYAIGQPNGSRSSTPTPSGSSTSGTSLPAPGRVGLWKVQGATHKVTGKRVSVWTFDKRAEMEGLGPMSKDHVLEVMKTEVTAVFTSIDVPLIPSSGCCSEQTAPSIHPRYILVVISICSANERSSRNG